MNRKTQKLVNASMLAALTCVATMIIRIPSPMKGYLNMGDCVVLLSGWLLLPGYGFLAAGIGSALADVFAGFVSYVPATFVIKGAMAIVAYFGFHLLHQKTGNLPARILSGILAELLMIIGYFVFEGFLYGFPAATVNIPASAIQGVVGLMIGTILIRLFEKTKQKDA